MKNKVWHGICREKGVVVRYTNALQTKITNN